MDVVSQNFRPELLNRLDDIVYFHPLGREHIASIAELQIDLLRQRLADRDLGIELDDKALTLLCDAGYDPVYGARPLKRAVQRLLEDPLATAILSGQYAPEQIIKVTANEGQMQFS
jgi:ATP-dependent Clp protease ATP-binding subunit ClpB